MITTWSQLHRCGKCSISICHLLSLRDICFVWDCRVYWRLNASWNFIPRCHGLLKVALPFILRGAAVAFTFWYNLCARSSSPCVALVLSTSTRPSTRSARIRSAKQSNQQGLGCMKSLTNEQNLVAQFYSCDRFIQILTIQSNCEAYQNYPGFQVSADVPPQVWCRR